MAVLPRAAAAEPIPKALKHGIHVPFAQGKATVLGAYGFVVIVRDPVECRLCHTMRAIFVLTQVLEPGGHRWDWCCARCAKS